jgi:putative heme-binding domain-containing protein
MLVVGNSDLDAARRITASQLLLHSQQHHQLAITSLAQWLKPQVDPLLQSQALLALQRSADEQIPAILHQAWDEWSPDLRTQALDAWLSREKWTNDLIHRLESKQISLSSISLTQRARLLQHPTATINQRSKQLFSQSQTSTRSEVLTKYRGTMQLTGDSARGKVVYQKSCASCHRRGDEGQEVGPNLATVVGHAPEKLLTNILDPNVDIQPGYQSYTCLLDTGEVLSGLLVSETANSVTIKQANGMLRSIARGEIEKLQNSNKSFMPEGLEDNISPQDMADLIRFLLEPLVQTAQ